MRDIKNEITTVAVSKETYKLLQELCKKTESYDGLIRRLIEAYSEYYEVRTRKILSQEK